MLDDFRPVCLKFLLGLLLAAPVEGVRAADAGKPAHIASPSLDKTKAQALPPEKRRQVEVPWIAPWPGSPPGRIQTGLFPLRQSDNRR